MGDETERQQPSLELPKLGLRRRKRPPAAPPSDEQTTDPGQAPVAEPVVEPVVEPVRSGGLRSVPVDETEPSPPPPLAAELTQELPVTTTEAPQGRRERRPILVRPTKPGGMLAAVVVGIVVGLGIVGLTWASLQGCTKVQGTTSCGQAGYGLLIGILVVMVLVGALLLRLARVTEPGATSFLAVGLASVLALLLLVDHLTDRSMVVVIPLVSAATYAAAHWVTRTFVDAA